MTDDEWGVDDLDVETGELVDDEDGTDEEPELVYGSVDQFVRQKLVLQYRRKVGAEPNQLKWRTNWWEYPEAVSRLTALWRAWEHLRLDPALGMATWWRDYAGPTMTALLDPEGPFAGGRDEPTIAKTKPNEVLPCDEPPDGWFPDVRAAS